MITSNKCYGDLGLFVFLDLKRYIEPSSFKTVFLCKFFVQITKLTEAI